DFFFQAEDGIRDRTVTGVQTCALPILQLGKLYFNHGRYAAAEREYLNANRAFPNYAYGLDALAQVEAALGRHARAISLERQAVRSEERRVGKEARERGAPAP